jgi:hypothetical protein
MGFKHRLELPFVLKLPLINGVPLLVSPGSPRRLDKIPERLCRRWSRALGCGHSWHERRDIVSGNVFFASHEAHDKSASTP